MPSAHFIFIVGVGQKNPSVQGVCSADPEGQKLPTLQTILVVAFGQKYPCGHIDSFVGVRHKNPSEHWVIFMDPGGHKLPSGHFINDDEFGQ